VTVHSPTVPAVEPETPAPAPGPPARPPRTRASIGGRRKAAVLLLSLGPERAADVVRHLPPGTAEQLAVELAGTRGVGPEEAETVLGELVELVRARAYSVEGGMEYARTVLTRSVGVQRASEILERVAAAGQTGAFEFLREAPPDQVVILLEGESAQVASLVLANLPHHELAGRLLQAMPAERQADVAKRIAVMGALSPEVVDEVAGVLRRQLGETVRSRTATTDGVSRLAQILSDADRTTERHVLDGLEEVDPDLAEAVRALLFVFEDIMKLDDRAIQLVLKEVDGKHLAVALRGASDVVKERVVANMSQRAAQILAEEMEYMAPQRRRVVEEAQSAVVAAVRKLEDAGAIVVPRGAEEEELVA